MRPVCPSPRLLLLLLSYYCTVCCPVSSLDGAYPASRSLETPTSQAVGGATIGINNSAQIEASALGALGKCWLRFIGVAIFAIMITTTVVVVLIL